jgi:hypothetical protein
MPKAVRAVASRPMTASSEQVWRVLGDLGRLPEWLAFADEVSDVSGEAVATPGATYTVKPKAAYEPQTHWRVSEVDPGRRQVHASEMPMFTGVTSTIEVSGGSPAQVDVVWTGMPKGVPARLMRPWFQKRIQRNWEQSLEALDRVASGR